MIRVPRSPLQDLSGGYTAKVSGAPAIIDRTLLEGFQPARVGGSNHARLAPEGIGLVLFVDQNFTSSLAASLRDPRAFELVYENPSYI